MSVNLEHEIRLDNKCQVINKKNTTTIVCSNPLCKKDLLIVVHSAVEEKKILYSLRVKCPFCPRQAYDFLVMGELKYVPAKDVLLTGIVERDSENLVIIETGRRV